MYFESPADKGHKPNITNPQPPLANKDKFKNSPSFLNSCGAHKWWHLMQNPIPQIYSSFWHGLGYIINLSIHKFWYLCKYIYVELINEIYCAIVQNLSYFNSKCSSLFISCLVVVVVVVGIYSNIVWVYVCMLLLIYLGFIRIYKF
jgi:hypothetical protein